MKKTLSLLLAIVLSLAVLPVVSLADEPVSEPITEAYTEVGTEPFVSPSEAYSEEASEAPSEEASEAPTEDATEPETTAPQISPFWLNLYVDSSLVVLKNRLMYIDDNVIYAPAAETAALVGINTSEVPIGPDMTLCLSLNEHAGYFFENNRYAIIDGTAIAMDKPCYKIDGVFYLPLDFICQMFSINMRIDTEVPNPDVYIESLISETGRQYADYVNSAHLTSDTDYLIWVSKANYSVRLFKKSSAGWRFVKEFPCAIGTNSTPTCEGTYKYYQKIAAWYYDDFYVGPVMRFNRGYALHSTLINYDGTMKNDRVKVKNSHGCVRMHPADIRYLVDNVPLYTTVHVTAK